MKSLLLLAALSCIWMSVDGASVMTPDPQLWNSTSMVDFETECLVKLMDEQNIILDSLSMKFSFLSVFVKITQNIRMQNSLDSLDTMIENICYPAIDEEKLYSLVMEVVKLCMDQDDPFTAEEKLLIKNKLDRLVCNVYMKLAAIISFSPDCMRDPATTTEISKCGQKPNLPTGSPRDWFFGNTEICMTQTKTLDCISQSINGQCSGSISGKIESVLAEARSILGCDAELNSVSVVNPL